MKKILTFLTLTFIAGHMFAGGILTNANQSAQYVRLLSRNASLGLDATYYNPAGLVRMDDGFYFALNNQSIWQDKTVTTTFPMNNSEYVGEVSAPLFPTFFAAYKTGKIAVSFGFGPNSGGGSAEYNNGLPSFEMPISQIPALMSGAGIPTDRYSADIYFNGSSIFWGSQLNFSYEINEMFSASVGVRMLNAKNTYEGYISNIMVDPQHPLNASGIGEMVSAPLFFQTLATAATTAGQSLQPIIDGSAGGFTLDQLVGAGQLTQAQADQLAGGLGAAYSPTLTVNEIQTMYYGNAAYAEANAGLTSDKEVDAVQKGLAFTPIFGLNINPTEKLNIGIKYELNTKLELTNDTKIDDTGMFTHDSTFRNDIPAILAIGIGYDISDRFRASVSYSTYFDKQADWGGKEDKVDNNLWEIAVGLEYDVTESLSLSAGYLKGATGVSANYQTDLSYSNSSNTVGFGGQYRVNEKLAIDLGFLITSYVDDEVGYTGYNMTYDKNTTDAAIGISYKF